MISTVYDNNFFFVFSVLSFYNFWIWKKYHVIYTEKKIKNVNYRWSFLPRQRLSFSTFPNFVGRGHVFLALTTQDWPNFCASCFNRPPRDVKSSLVWELKLPQRPHNRPLYDEGTDTSRKLIPSQRTLIPMCVLTITLSVVQLMSNRLVMR